MKLKDYILDGYFRRGSENGEEKRRQREKNWSKVSRHDTRNYTTYRKTTLQVMLTI